MSEIPEKWDQLPTMAIPSATCALLMDCRGGRPACNRRPSRANIQVINDQQKVTSRSLIPPLLSTILISYRRYNDTRSRCVHSGLPPPPSLDPARQLLAMFYQRLPLPARLQNRYHLLSRTLATTATNQNGGKPRLYKELAAPAPPPPDPRRPWFFTVYRIMNFAIIPCA